MTFAYAVHVRAVQALFTIIVLGLTAYDASAWSWNWSPSEVNFLLFVSIWTILALAYLMITPGRYEVAAHKFGILAAETVTMIFWFAGWVALASLLGDIRCGSRWGPCRAAIAATIFGAFEWLLWCATAVMAALHVHRTRNTSNTKHDPAIEVHQGN